MNSKLTGKSPIDTVLVSYNCTHGDNSICIVGRKVGGTLEIINAFEGNKANEIYRMLTEKKEK